MFQSIVIDAGLIYCIRPDDVSEILNSGKVQIGTIILGRKTIIEGRIESAVHADDRVIVVAGDMEPGAGIGKRRIPALQHVVWVLPCQPLLVQYVTFKRQQHVSEKTRIEK
jgi:hypothetical protein